MTSSIPLESHLSIALVGAGRVGTAVAALLAGRGHRVTKVFSRTPASAQAAADRLEAKAFGLHELDLAGADLVLIGVSESALTEVVHQVSSVISTGAMAVHFAGSVGTTPLEPIRVAGAQVAALHPVQAVPDVDAGVARIPGCAWGITCAPALQQWAVDLITTLEGRPFFVDEADRAVWHAAAVTTSNALAALLASGGELLRAIGIDGPERVLGPLAEGTIANAIDSGLSPSTITGPVVRGETETIERHLQALGTEGRSELLESYTLAAQLVLATALRAARVDAATHNRMLELLGR